MLDGLTALLDQRGKDLLRFGVGERLALLDLLVFEGGFDHAQGREAFGFAGFHRGNDVFFNLLGEAHCVYSSRKMGCEWPKLFIIERNALLGRPLQWW